MKKLQLLLLFLTTTIGHTQQAYYDNVNLNKKGLALKNELSKKIRETHKKTITYKNVWEACKKTDKNPSNSKEVFMLYGYSDSGKTKLTKGVNDNGGKYHNWNREHVFPKSLASPKLKTHGAGADSHNLRTADVRFNRDRGNLKFISGSGVARKIEKGWYPGDQWKGDVARMIMYMYLRYENRCKPTYVVYGNKNKIDNNMVDMLLDWNSQDPPSLIESQRNKYHTSNQKFSQGNRNPFIDNPYLATLIWGGKKAVNLWGNKNISGAIAAPSEPTIAAPSELTIDIKQSNALLNWKANNTKNTYYKLTLSNGLSATTKNTNYTFKNLKRGKYTANIICVQNRTTHSKKVSIKFEIKKKNKLKNYEKNIIVYPNPSKYGRFKIKLPKKISVKKYQLYNSSGQLVNSKRGHTRKIHIKNLRETGIYFLKIYTDKGIFTKKLIYKY